MAGHAGSINISYGQFAVTPDIMELSIKQLDAAEMTDVKKRDAPNVYVLDNVEYYGYAIDDPSELRVFSFQEVVKIVEKHMELKVRTKLDGKISVVIAPDFWDGAFPEELDDIADNFDVIPFSYILHGIRTLSPYEYSKLVPPNNAKAKIRANLALNSLDDGKMLVTMPSQYQAKQFRQMAPDDEFVEKFRGLSFSGNAPGRRKTTSTKNKKKAVATSSKKKNKKTVATSSKKKKKAVATSTKKKKQPSSRGNSVKSTNSRKRSDVTQTKRYLEIINKLQNIAKKKNKK